MSKKAFAEADKEKSDHLTVSTLHSALEKVDQNIRALAAITQIAYQDGCYLAHLLNQLTNFQ